MEEVNLGKDLRNQNLNKLKIMEEKELKTNEGTDLSKDEVVVSYPDVVMSADLNDKGTISISVYDLKNCKFFDNYKEGNNLSLLLNDTTTDLIKEDIDPKKIRILYGEAITKVMINSELEKFKDQSIKRMIEMKKKNSELLSEETCVLDETTKSSILKAITVIDKVIDVIQK